MPTDWREEVLANADAVAAEQSHELTLRYPSNPQLRALDLRSHWSSASAASPISTAFGDISSGCCRESNPISSREPRMPSTSTRRPTSPPWSADIGWGQTRPGDLQRPTDLDLDWRCRVVNVDAVRSEYSRHRQRQRQR
jgi:hypothetical protein